jgi:hypothetical protein
LALEDWEIYKRWETARMNGQATIDTHPALPEDRLRHNELQAHLAPHLAIDPQTALGAKAEFQAGDLFGKSALPQPPRVRWTPIESD